MTRAAKRGVPTLVLMQRGCRQGPAGGRLSILAPTTVAFTLVGPSNLPRRKPSVINGRLDQLSHFHALSRQTSRARGEHTEGGPQPPSNPSFRRYEAISVRRVVTCYNGISGMSAQRLAHRDIRGVRLLGKVTTISVELPIWHYFCIIAQQRGVTIGTLLDYVNRTHRLEPTITGKVSVRNLSSAVRMFVMSQCELKPQPKPNPRIKWVK